MSDVQPVPPTVAHTPARGELLVPLPGAEGLAPLTSRVGDATVRAIRAAERVHLLARGHATRDAVAAIDAELNAARSALCVAVGALARQLRHEGAPPQRMLVVVKDAVRTAASAALGGRELMGDAVRCGIEAYYETPPA